jgi:hypothetical protein
MMERNQPEWVQRFGAKMRTERPVSFNDPLPDAIVAKLLTIEDVERRQRARESDASIRR